MSSPSRTTPAWAMALAGALALAAAMGIGRFAFTPVLPMMLDDAGLSIQGGSWLAAANYAGYLAGALLASWRPGDAGSTIRRNLVAIALLTFAMAAPLPVGALAGLRFAAGMSSALILIAVSGWSLRTFAAMRRPALPAMVFSGVGTGIAAAGLACAAVLLSGGPSWLAWLALGTIASAAGIVSWPAFGAAGATPPRQAHPQPAFRWHRDAVLLTACYGVFGFGYIIPATYLPALAKAALSDPAQFGWAWPMFGLAAAVSTLLVIPGRRLIGNRGLLTSSYLLMAAGVALPALAIDLVTVCLSALCVGGTFMVLTFTALEEARRMAGESAVRLIGMMTAAFAVGQIAGPLAVAAAGNSGLAALLLLAAALLASSGLALAILRRSVVPGAAPDTR